ncbi:hypothetical protein [Vibrio owensii]|uniref:hypothetical protein n=1 Tax=Vibrio owensii TaxID=696485 RepID=UPI0018F19306|nr:hypothetical protein [Vibrio owensii]
MVQRRVPYGTSPLFPELVVDKKRKKPQKKASKSEGVAVKERPKVKEDVDEPVSSMLVLLFPECYPEEFEALNKELELGVWDCVTDEHIRTIQWLMMDEFEETFSKDTSARELYIDYSMWVILENESDETNPFSYKNVVRATYGLSPTVFAAALALRIWHGASSSTKSGAVFKKIRNKYENKLSRLIVAAGFTL